MFPLELNTPQRQAPLGVIIIFLINLRRWANALIFGALPFVTQNENSLPFWIFYVFAGVFVLVLGGFSYLQWKNYFFSIEDDKFVIRQGVLRKEETLIGLERIQSVHIKRNIVQQILNLAALQLDTAGSSKKEVQIPALKYDYAEELKRALIAIREEQKPLVNAEDDVTRQSSPSPAVTKAEREIMKLSLGDLLMVGLTENHLRSGLILLGVFFGYTYQISDLLGLDEESIYAQAFRFVLIVLPIFIIGFLIISVVLSMVRVFLRYFELTVSIKKTGLSIKSGLLKREENFVPVNKIQYLRWRSNPLRRLIGFKSLSIYQASSQEVQKKKTIKVPGCKAIQNEAIQQEFYPEYADNAGYTTFKPNALWKIRLWFFFGILPLAVAVFFFYVNQFELMGAAALVAVLSVFFVHKYVQRFRAALSADLLVINRGYVYPEETMLKLFKVQNVAVKQSIFQKHRGLVSLRIYTASGSLSIPFIPEEHGTAIANKLLYAVETSTKPWM